MHGTVLKRRNFENYAKEGKTVEKDCGKDKYLRLIFEDFLQGKRMPEKIVAWITMKGRILRSFCIGKKV